MPTIDVIVFGATGGLGQQVWRRAVDAGHAVTAFVRSPSKLDRADPRHASLRIIEGNALDADAVRAAAKGRRVAINATSPAGGDATLELAKSIVDNASAAGVERFYMVGGLGALWAPGTDKTVLVQDWDDADAMARYGLPSNMPREAIQRMTRGHLASMAYLESTGLRHTFLCPGAMVDRPLSEARLVTLDELGGQAAGEVPYADVAQVIADDLASGDLIGHRVCVSPVPR